MTIYFSLELTLEKPVEYPSSCSTKHGDVYYHLWSMICDLFIGKNEIIKILVLEYNDYLTDPTLLNAMTNILHLNDEHSSIYC